MQIEKNGSGPWPEVNLDGVKITLSAGGESFVFDCSGLQEDSQVTVDVVRGQNGGLAVGVENGTDYVANLIIPPARYEDVTLPAPLAEEELPEDVDPICISSMPTTERVRVPLSAADMEAVRLILWTINDNNQEG